MSRDTRPQRTVRRAVDRRLQERKENQKPSRVSIIGIVVFLLGVPGILGGIYYFLPRISVTPDSALISSDAFSAPFAISNDGVLTLYDVRASCSPRGVTYQKPGHSGSFTLGTEGPDEGETGGATSPALMAEKLLPASKVNFPCPLEPKAVDAKGNPVIPPEWIVSADVLFVVSYHDSILPFLVRHHENRFGLSRDSSGQYHWLEEPLKSKAS